MLLEFLLEKSTKKEPILKHALLKVVGRKYRQHIPEILRRASKHMELVFGLELTEVDRSRNIYALINKLNLGGNEGLSDGWVDTQVWFPHGAPGHYLHEG